MGGGEGMLVGSCGASTGVWATTSTVSPLTIYIYDAIAIISYMISYVYYIIYDIIYI